MQTIALVTPGPTEWVLILVIVLVLFGAKKLPELAKSLGQSMNEFRKAREEFDKELHQAGQDLEECASKYPALPGCGAVPANSAAATGTGSDCSNSSPHLNIRPSLLNRSSLIRRIFYQPGPASPDRVSYVGIEDSGFAVFNLLWWPGIATSRGKR